MFTVGLNGRKGIFPIPLLELNRESRSIDFSKPSVVYCEEGYRATIAATMWMRDNAADIGILIDGIQGWQARNLPMGTVKGTPKEPFR
jgi:rhodanese-related sulfurtransferase